MTFRNKVHIGIMAVLLVAYILAEYAAPRKLDWRPNYDPAKDSPYGLMIAADLISTAFPGAEVVQSGSALYDLLLVDSLPRPMNLILISDELRIDNFDSEMLLDLADSGSSVFLAAEDFSGLLADSLKLSTAISLFGTFLDPDLERKYGPSIQGDTVATDAAANSEDGELPRYEARFTNAALSGRSFATRGRAASWYLSSVDSSAATQLGTVTIDEDVYTNFVRIPFGDGQFLVTTMPLAFTNYALVDSASAGWAFAALSHLPVEYTVLNYNYIPGRGQRSTTPLRYILSQDALRWAWFTILGSVLLFIVFRAKRRQRIIPTLVPNQNATLQFVDTVGRLYFQRGNHLNLASKKINHFQEYVRSKLGIDARTLDTATVARIAARSGIAVEEIEKLARSVQNAAAAKSFSADDLQRLSKRIDAFYRDSRR